MALTAAPLEPGVVQFFSNTGVPLAAGLLYTYVPGGSTPKTTWQDPTQTSANANPITLDANGRAVVFGTGLYRLQLFDSASNLQWDNEGEATDPGYIASALPVFVGDTGSGGVIGQVPAPAAGSAALGAYLSANGSFQQLLVPTPSAGNVQPTQAGRMFPQSRLMVASDTLTLADAGGNVTNNLVGGATLTIPTDATANWFVSQITQVMINNIVGSGNVSVTPATGVQLYWPGSSGTPGTRTLAGNGQAILTRITVNVWTILGGGVS